MNALTSADLARRVHDELVLAWRHRRSAEHAAALLLARVDRERLYLPLGHVSTVAYAVGALELTPRQARALVQLGRSLPSLPALDAAFAAGEVGWTKARELLRVVTPETEAAWTARAKEVDSRMLERLVTGARIGDAPHVGSDAPLGPPRVRLVFEVEAHEAQAIRDAIAAVRAQVGVRRDELGDGALLAALAERALHAVEAEGPVTEERYRVVVRHCPGCGSTTGVDHEVTDTVASEACCDAEVVSMEGVDRGRLARTVPPRVRRVVLHRDGYRCAVPGCRNRLWLHLHHVRHRAHGGGHGEHNLVTLCSAHHRLAHDGVLVVPTPVAGAP